MRHYVYRLALRRAQALGRPFDLASLRLPLTYRPADALLQPDDRG